MDGRFFLWLLLIFFWMGPLCAQDAEVPKLTFQVTEMPYDFSVLDRSLEINDAYKSGEEVWVITSGGVFLVSTQGELLLNALSNGFRGLLRRDGSILGYWGKSQGQTGIYLKGGEGQVRANFQIPSGPNPGKVTLCRDRVMVHTPLFNNGPFAGSLKDFASYDFSGKQLNKTEMPPGPNKFYTSTDGYTAVVGEEDGCSVLKVFRPDGGLSLVQKSEYNLHWVSPEGKRILQFTTEGKTVETAATFVLLDEAGRELNRFNMRYWPPKVQLLGHQKYILFHAQDEVRLADWKTGEEIWRQKDLRNWGFCLSWDQKTLFRFYAVPEFEIQSVTYLITAHDIKSGEEIGYVDFQRKDAHFDEDHNRFEQIDEHRLELCDSKGCFLLDFEWEPKD